MACPTPCHTKSSFGTVRGSRYSSTERLLLDYLINLPKSIHDVYSSIDYLIWSVG